MQVVITLTVTKIITMSDEKNNLEFVCMAYVVSMVLSSKSVSVSDGSGNEIVLKVLICVQLCNFLSRISI